MTEVIEDDSPKPWLKTNLVEGFQYANMQNLYRMLDVNRYTMIAYERISKIGYMSFGYFLYQLDKADMQSLCNLTKKATEELKALHAGTIDYTDCKALQQVTLLVALIALGEGYGDSDNDWSKLRVKFYESLTNVLESLVLDKKLDYRKLSLVD